MPTDDKDHPSSTKPTPHTDISISNAPVANTHCNINISDAPSALTIDMAPSDDITDTASATADDCVEPTASAKGERKERRKKEKQKEKDALQQSFLEAVKNLPLS